MVYSPNVGTIRRFYDIADGRVPGDLTGLFTDDVEVYAPKFGTGSGLDALMAAGAGRARFKRTVRRSSEPNSRRMWRARSRS